MKEHKMKEHKMKEHKMKEHILNDFKDLVSTVRSPNFNNEKVKQLWREKFIRVQEEMDQLSKEDLAWVTKEYSSWHKKNIIPYMDNGLTELAKKESIP